MADLTAVYAALKKADAAGDAAAAKTLADYIRTQAPPQKVTPPANPADSSQYDNTLQVGPLDTHIPISGGVQNFLAGAGKATMDLGRGAGQMLGLTSRQDVADSRKLDAPLMATGAGKAGMLTGTVADLLPAAFVPGANTLAGSAAIGAGSGLLQPSTSTGETVTNTGLGALMGPGSLLAGRAIGAAAKGLKASLWDPFTQAGQQRIASQTLQAFAGGPKAAGEAATALGNAPPVLPGVQPTTAELANNAGLAQLQKTVSANPEILNQLTQRAQGNRAAMVGALGDIAGTPAERQGAQDLRSQVTDSMYRAANNVVVPSDAKLEAILQRPSMAKAWQRAQQLAAERGDTLTIPDPAAPLSLPASRAGATSGMQFDPLTLKPTSPFNPLGGAAGRPATADAISGAATSLPARQSSILDPLTLGMAKPTRPQYSGKAIQYLKMSLNDIANTGPQMGMGSHEVGAVKSTLGDLNSWTAQNVPKLRMADQIFAKLSQPLNQMDIGQQLSNKLLPALTDFGQNTRLSANQFATGMRNGDSIAADVTGMKSAKLADILGDTHMQTIRQIGEQLARTANAAELGAPKGSPTAQNLISQNVLSQFLGPLGLPQGMAGRMAGSAFGRTIAQPGKLVYGALEPDIMKLLGHAALDPKVAQGLLQATQNPAVSQALWARQGLLNPVGTQAVRGLLGNAPQ